MFWKEVLVQLLKPGNEFELKDLAGSYEEANASKTYIFVWQRVGTSSLWKFITLNTKNKLNQNFSPTLFAGVLW